MTITLTTFDEVPEFAQGYVRDFRIRWTLEELGLPYQVDTVPGEEKTAEHLSRQPFGQVPMIRDGDLSLFETGAILLYLTEGTALKPAGRDGALVLQWVIAALNSVEPYVMQWEAALFFDQDQAAADKIKPMVRQRLSALQTALGDRDWLVGDSFTVADLLLAEMLRIPGENGLLDDLPKLAAYAERATSRPAFARAMRDHMRHWQGDAAA